MNKLFLNILFNWEKITNKDGWWWCKTILWYRKYKRLKYRKLIWLKEWGKDLGIKV